MKKILGFITLFAISLVHAEETIILPTESSFEIHQTISPFVERKPIVLIGGYQLEDSIFRSRTYDCGIDIRDLNLSAQLVWEGAIPKVMIVGDDLARCRSPENSPFELDLTDLMEQLPNYELYRLEIVNHVNFHQ